jgi:serine/threonine protein kinase
MAYDHVKGTRVAIKQIKDVFGVFENAKRIYREIKLLRALDHENIVKIVHIQKPKCVSWSPLVYFMRGGGVCLVCVHRAREYVPWYLRVGVRGVSVA